MSALIPFIGLPAVKPPSSNGHESEPVRPSPIVPAFTAPPTEEEDETVAIPAQRQPELEQKRATPSPADVAARVGPGYKPGDTTYMPGLQRPTDAEFDKAIKAVGDEPTRIAEYLNVPRGNVYSWLQGYRNRKKRAGQR